MDLIENLMPAGLTTDDMAFNRFMVQYAKENDTLEGVTEAYEESKCSQQ